MSKNRAIDDVALTHFTMRPMLVNTLRGSAILQPELVGGATNWLDFWVNSFNDRFFDMGTFARLGSAVEATLRDYYMRLKKHKNVAELKTDPDYKQNIFQRILPNKSGDGDCVKLFEKIGVDLKGKTGFAAVQEMMLHRHLYVHNSGVVDEDYLAKHSFILGTDITPDVTTQGYPNEDVVWFRPLGQLQRFIEASRSFRAELV